MTAKLTPKQEAFCQRYIETGNASEAYRLSYEADKMNSDSVRVEANRLLNNPNIALRVVRLQEEHRQRHNVTVDLLTTEYDEVRLLALADKQFAPANTAITGKAKLHGLIVDRNEHTGKDGGPIVVATKEQRDAAVAAALAADT